MHRFVHAANLFHVERPVRQPLAVDVHQQVEDAEDATLFYT